MDKKTFVQILQVALFYFDEVTEKEIKELLECPEDIIETGVALCKYLNESEND